MKWILGFLLIAPAFFLEATEDIKLVIAEKQKNLLDSLTDSQKSQAFYELAVAYVQDQEIDKSFFYFLEALKVCPKKETRVDPEEDTVYQCALDHYLMKTGSDPMREAEALLSEYGEKADRNPNFYKLNFLISTAYANIGKYKEFFEKFYRCYPFNHDTFLAFKTQGILYLRLSHHSLSAQERIYFQNESFRNLTLALERQPHDASLYKVLIFLAKDEKNDEFILSYLQKIVKNQVLLPRGDIYFYVREAVSLGQLMLGQTLIDQAKSHYEYSRALTAAQDYVDQYRAGGN